MKKMVNGELIDMTADEISARQAEEQEWNDSAFDRSMVQLRVKRNRLLAETDWTSSSDLTMSDEMKTYRQELRDATNGLDTVEKVEAYTFPTKVTK